MEKNLTKTKQQQYFFGDTPVTVHFVKEETITDRATKKKDDRDDAKKKRRKRRDICVLYFVCHSTNCVAISIRVHCILNNVFPCSAEYIRG